MPKAKPAAPKRMLHVTLTKSLSGRHKKHIATAASLGLRHIGSKSVQPDNPATRGKLAQIAYLVNISEVAEQ